MAETSFLWSGTTPGDASSSPYDHLEFTRMFNKILASDGAGYVVPGYANSLNVQASAPLGASVDVDTGAAYVKGFLYENDVLKTLTIAANASGNPRIDRIILRVDFLSQTVRLVVLQGTAAAAPAPPALTQNYGTVWEISLAYVWVANGFATLANSVIHDSRDMLQTAAALSGYHTRENLIRGSELIPKIVGAIAGGAVQGIISGTWSWSAGVAPTLSFTTKPTQQTRGNAVVVTANAVNTRTIQSIGVKPNTVYTLRALVKDISGGQLTVDIYGIGSAAVLISRTIQFANTWVDETIRFTTGASDTNILVRYAIGNALTFHFGQAVLTEGWNVGNYDPVHEWIMFWQTAVDANWNFTAKSTIAGTNISLLAAWGALGAFNDNTEIQAVAVLLGGRDSGSAGAAAGSATFYVFGYGAVGIPYTDAPVILELAGETNDNVRYASGIVPVNYSVSTVGAGRLSGIAVRLTATGAGTFDAYLGITGVLT